MDLTFQNKVSSVLDTLTSYYFGRLPYKSDDLDEIRYKIGDVILDRLSHLLNITFSKGEAESKKRQLSLRVRNVRDFVWDNPIWQQKNLQSALQVQPGSEDFIIALGLAHIARSREFKTELQAHGYNFFHDVRALKDQMRQKRHELPEGTPYEESKGTAVNIYSYHHIEGTFFYYENFYMLGQKKENGSLKRGIDLRNLHFEEWIFYI